MGNRGWRNREHVHVLVAEIRCGILALCFKSLRVLRNVLGLDDVVRHVSTRLGERVQLIRGRGPVAAEAFLRQVCRVVATYGSTVHGTIQLVVLRVTRWKEVKDPSFKIERKLEPVSPASSL